MPTLNSKSLVIEQSRLQEKLHPELMENY